MNSENFELVGKDPKFLKAAEFAKNVAVTRTPFLIVGEAGTGKRTLCRYIHEQSARSHRPFKVVDCSKDHQEVENEILGYRDDETGRFNKGVLEDANGGSVILANIEGLEETFQKRLFTILQDLSDYDLDVRVMATTTKNLSKFVGAGRFYRALYTHFSSTQIMIPPLRERQGDIEVIAHHILNDIAKELNKGSIELDGEAVDKISNYYWANNIYELNLVLEKACENASGDKICLEDLEIGERKADAKMAKEEEDDDGIRLMSLKEAEKVLIKKALIHTSENRTQAAKILGVSIRTLRNKINEYRGQGASYFVNLR